MSNNQKKDSKKRPIITLFKNILSDSAKSKSFKIIGIYFLFGSIWIVTTDILSENLFLNYILKANIAKGLIYVSLTSILIYSLIYPALKKIIIVQDKLKKVNSQLEEANLKLRDEKQKIVESEKKMKESEILFRTIFEQSTIGIAIGRSDNVISSFKEMPGINPMFEKIIGRTREEYENILWTDLTHPDDLTADLDSFQKFKDGLIDGYDMEKRLIRPDGSNVWVHMIISPLKLENTTKYNHLCLMEDISKRKEMEKTLQDSERSKAVLIDNMPGMAYRCKFDRNWTMLFVSEGCFDLTGYRPESLLNNKEMSFNDLIAPKYQEYLWENWEHAIEEKSKLIEEYELITASGEIKWVWEQGQGVYDENGNVIAIEGLIIDITRRKNQEMKLKYINEHDSLTGLYNRRYFDEVIMHDLETNIQEKCAILFINLRNFSLLNATYGYTYCENSIKKFAKEISERFTDDFQLFHISIDQFIVYIKNYHNEKELEEASDIILEKLNDIFKSNIVGGSIGIVEIDNMNYDTESIIKNASIAAENVDENQLFGYCFFNKDMEKKLVREVMIKNQLAEAAFNVFDKSIYIVYQPIINLKTNKIYGFEALARMNSETLGNVSPMEFIPIAEKTQLIVPLGKKIMKLAFGFLKQIDQIGYHDIELSFNVSAIQLLRDDFLSDLMQTINDTKINPNNVNIEITESIFSNNYQEINDKLEKIRKLGIKISIDDFGTGYSSLARERELNINCLKIDKYFIDKLNDCDVNDDITGDIISMAHKMGHSVVAEGVECEQQKKYLIEHNCDLMQGYLFSKPLSETLAIDILTKKI